MRTARRFVFVSFHLGEGTFGWRTMTMIAVLASGLCSVGEAQALRRRGHSSYNSSAIRQRQQQAVIQAALAQRNAAKQVLAAAESTGAGAQSKLDSAMSKLKESSE